MYIIERGEVGLYHSYSDKNDKESHINTLKVYSLNIYFYDYKLRRGEFAVITNFSQKNQEYILQDASHMQRLM